jgi:hypothetical protein
LTALEAGAISAGQARYLADAVRCVDDAAARQVEAEVLPDGADRVDVGRFRRQVRRAVAAADPRGPEQRHAEAAEQRRVYVMPQPDAMACVVANLPAEGAQALMIVLVVRAEQCAPDDHRSADQRRADALVQLALDALNGYGSCVHCNTERPHSTMPRWQGLRPTVNVTVALSTLLGLDEQPGELDGYGPIPASVAVRIATDEDATWRRLITDELGKLVDYGRTTYGPPAELRDFVINRDRTCQFPTCNLPRKRGTPIRLLVRNRPHHRLAGRRPHQPRQPRRAVLPASPRQARRRLAAQAAAGQEHRVDEPDRAHVRRAGTELPDRPDQ